ASERDQHLLALALEPGNVLFHLRQIDIGPHMQLQRPLRGLMVHVGEGHDDDIPLWRHIAQREDGPVGTAAGPVADELVSVTRTRGWHRRDCRWGRELRWV